MISPRLFFLQLISSTALCETFLNLNVDKEELTSEKSTVSWVKTSSLCAKHCVATLGQLGPTVHEFDSINQKCRCVLVESVSPGTSGSVPVSFTGKRTTYAIKGDFLKPEDLDLWDFFEGCDCLVFVEAPYRQGLSNSIGNCIDACFADERCHVFSYNSTSYHCMLYDRNAVRVSTPGINIGCNSTGNDSTAFLKIRAPSNDCEDIQTENTLDGYYNVSVHGVSVRVYCVMSNSPALTYLDISGYSRWAGSMHDDRKPWQSVTRTWHRAKLLVTPCLLTIDNKDFRFSEQNEIINSTYSQHFYEFYVFTFSQQLAGGGTCNNYDGEASVDLSGTPFKFANWIQLDYGLFRPSINRDLSELNDQNLYIRGWGSCGHGLIKNYDGGHLSRLPIEVLDY